jgi:long-chain fatty acid transport protein
MRATVGVSILASAVALAAPAHAGGFGVPEYGARRTGMGAVIGRPDEPAAVFHNPAGLTMLPGLHLYVSMGGALLRTEFQLKPWDRSDEFLDEPVSPDGYYPTVRPTRAAAVIPMMVATYEAMPDRLYLALSTYVTNATGAAFEEDAVTRYHLIDGYVVSPLVQVSAAYRIDRTWSVGAGLGALNVRVHGKRLLFPIVDQDNDPSTPPLDLTNLFGKRSTLTINGSDWKLAWNAGVLAQPTKKLSLGAAVIARVDPTLEGKLYLDYGDDAAFAGQREERIGRTGLLLPWTFHAGANYDVHPQLEIGTDFRYWLYRQYDVQRTEIDEGFNGLNELKTPKNFHDAVQLSGGVRLHGLHAAPGLELMLGAHADRTPAPPETVTLDQPTFSHVAIRSGLRYTTGRYRLGLTYLHQWFDIPDIDDSITFPPSNVRGSGSNNILTLTFEATLARP